MGRDRIDLVLRMPQLRFQPTLPVWGETDAAVKLAELIAISTHSPRVGRDELLFLKTSTLTDFNPLSPCGERPDKFFNLV